MTTMTTLELDLYAPLPRGHRARVWYVEHKGWLLTSERVALEDMSTGVWYVPEVELSLAARLRGEEEWPDNQRVRRWLEGQVRSASVGLRSGETGSVLTRLVLEVDREVQGGDDPAGRRGAWRFLASEQAVLYGGAAGVEQVWPGGLGQRVLWSEPFQVSAHRSPRAPAGPTGEVHLRLTQRRGEALHRVTVTAVVPWSEGLAALTPLEVTSPLLRGEEAVWLVEQVRHYSKVHGVESPL